MKKIFLLTALAVLLGVANAAAQQIAVVSEDGETTVYQTLPQAIDGAEPGSVIYLPGGGFPISDEMKITKRLTIIGIGHRSDNDNVDGITTISGSLGFYEGSSGSAVMGCYITGNVIIMSVSNVLIKCCNLNRVDVNNSSSIGTNISQNYIRNRCDINASCRFNNNICRSVYGINGGTIENNIFASKIIFPSGGYYGYVLECNNSYVSNNIFIETAVNGSSNTWSNNLSTVNLGDNPINIGNVDWNDVFVNFNGAAVNPMSDFHFKEAYQQYSDIGIYGGSGFNDHQTAPVPYIVAKRIAEETDAAGQLKIQVRVKAGE